MPRRRVELPTVEPTAPPAPGSLTHRARRGAMWTGASAILLRFSNILIMAVVARIIAPDELGVYALAITVHGFVLCLASWGVTAAIGRSDLDADRLGPTITTVAVISSCSVAGVMALIAGPAAAALGVPEAAGPIRILSIAVALQGIFAVSGAQIQREFRQQVIFRANVVAFVLSSAALLLLATVINGAEAFAWSRVVGNVVVGSMMVMSLDKRYRLGWHAAFVGPLLRFGVPAALGSVLSQLVLNVDYLIVGREMSTTDLGLYMLAFTICSWPTAALGAVMDQIVLPAFSGVRRDGGNLRVTVFRAVRAVALVACPIGAFTFSFARPLIETVYGGKWLAAAPVVSVLALYGVLFVLGMLFDNIMIASGRTVTMFAVQAAVLVALVPALIVGIRVGGLIGVAVAHILVVLIITTPAYAVAIKVTTDAGIATILRGLSRPTLAAVVAAGVAFAGCEWIHIPIVKLAAGGVIGASVYMAVVGPELLQLFPARLANLRIMMMATGWLVSLQNRWRDQARDSSAERKA